MYIGSDIKAERLEIGPKGSKHKIKFSDKTWAYIGRETDWRLISDPKMRGKEALNTYLREQYSKGVREILVVVKSGRASPVKKKRSFYMLLSQAVLIMQD